MVVKTQKRGNIARAAIYKAISDRWIANRYAPTIREISAETGYSIATVHRHIRVLTAQGHLQGVGRTLRPGVVS